MEYLVISNKGEVDPQAFTLLGASVKDDQAIGFFGSGNKYAIAALFRLGIRFRVFSGEREVKFTARPSLFRGEAFNIIHVDDQPTSITTRTGPKWRVPDAIREFYSNALDEGEGDVRASDAVPYGTAGRSAVWIEMTKTIRDMWQSWHLYFLPKDAEVLHSTPHGRIVKQSTPNYFRRGVWICEDRQDPPLFSYDYEDFDLPESRKVNTGAAAWKLHYIFQAITSEEVINTLLSHVKGRKGEREWGAISMYRDIDRVSAATIHHCFKKKYDFIGLTNYEDRIELKKGERVLWCRSSTFTALRAIGLKDIAEAVNFNAAFTVCDWPIGIKAQVDAEITFLADRGVDLRSFPIEYADFESDEVIAMADMKGNRVLIGQHALSADPIMLRRALIEEWTHLVHRVADHTVQQQHVYLSLICSLMEAQGAGAKVHPIMPEKEPF